MGGPFFIPDLSAHQGELPNFDAITTDPRMVGCIIKATQGVTYSPSWFTVNWPRVRIAGGWRYGFDWFRGCYHYATPTPSGTAQADYLLDTVESAGGWGEGDMPPAWDLEGTKWSSRQQVVDVSSQFSERVKQRLGKTPILYTGSTWRKFNVQERAGFSQLWSTHMDKMAPFGWPNENYMLWQYSGTGKYYNPATALFGYPIAIPGLPSSIDMNVVLDGGVPASSMDRVRYVLTGREDRSWAVEPRMPPSDRGQIALPKTPVDRGAGRLLVPLTIGAGLLIAGILLVRNAREDLL